MSRRARRSLILSILSLYSVSRLVNLLSRYAWRIEIDGGTTFAWRAGSGSLRHWFDISSVFLDTLLFVASGTAPIIL